ncbi:MAG: hypothetical protein WDM90_12905 [Ferruginibacter sp.]
MNGGAGMSASEEVTGGDGGIVAIDQNEPQYQFGSYVYGNYRRSTNGGLNWSSITEFGSSTGMFINPYDYASVDNRFYAAYAAGQYIAWTNPQTGTTRVIVNVATLVVQQYHQLLLLLIPPREYFLALMAAALFR